MSRRSNQKLKLLYLSKILLDMTDERNGITLTQISQELSKYGIETGRKSLYDDLEALRVYGYDVCSYRDRYVRYYIKERNISRAEIKLLCDLARASGILDETERGELTKRLWQTEYMSGINLSDSVEYAPALGEELYKNIKLICNAMTGNVALTFKCFEWNAHKQRRLLFAGHTFTVSPWALDYTNDGYILTAFDHDTGAIDSFPIDKILMAALTAYEREGEELFKAYGNGKHEAENIRLRCNNTFAHRLFSKFGTGVTVLANTDNEFEVSFKTRIGKDFFAWLFASEGMAAIISPQWAVDKYEEMLNRSLNTESHEADR